MTKIRWVAISILFFLVEVVLKFNSTHMSIKSKVVNESESNLVSINLVKGRITYQEFIQLKDKGKRQ